MLGRLFGRGRTRGLSLSTLDARDLDTVWNSVVGESYRQDALKATLREGREFTAVLVHERDNKHDTNAVMVYSTHGHVGYLPREDAADWARILDAVANAGYQGMAVDGKIHGGEPGKPTLGCVVGLPRDPGLVVAEL